MMMIMMIHSYTLPNSQPLIVLCSYARIVMHADIRCHTHHYIYQSLPVKMAASSFALRVTIHHQVKGVQCSMAAFQHVQKGLCSHDQDRVGSHSLGPKLSIDWIL